MAAPPTPQQLQLLKVLPRVTGSLSILGSTYIIWDILRSRKGNGTSTISSSRRRFKVSEGFLLGMSVCDILASVTTPLIGNEAAPPPFGHGNQATCNAQGFFSQFVTATALYTGCLALIYLLSIRYGYKEAQLSSCLEPVLHLCVLLFVLISGSVSIYLELYNPTPFSCTLVSNPPVCGGTSEDDVPCLRGEHASDWRLPFRTIPEYAVVAFSTIAMIMIYWSVKNLERKSMRYSVRTLPLHFTTGIPNNCSTNLEPEQAQVQVQSEEEAEQETIELDAPEEEEDVVAPFEQMDEETAITQEGSVDKAPANKKEVSFPMNTTTDDNDEDRTTSFHDDSGETSTTVNFNGACSASPANATTDDVNPQTSTSSPLPSCRGTFQQSNSSYLGRQCRQSSSSLRQRRRQLLLSRDVGIQGICFILAFLLTWTVPTIARCLLRFGGHNLGIEWMIAVNFFLPLQGFWNVLVYTRPRLFNSSGGAGDGGGLSSTGGAGGGSSSLRASKNSS